MKNGILLAVTFLLLLFLIDGAVALGISPGRATFNFEPNVEKVVALTIVNTEHKAMNVSIRVEGEWAQFVELNQTRLEFEPDEEEKSVRYNIKFPLEGGLEGIKIRIIASEIASQKETAMIGVLLAVEHQIYVITNITNVSKEPGGFNITQVSVKKYQQGQTAQIEIEVKNPSSKVLENVYATMVIFDKYGNLRSQFNSTPVRIEPNSSRVIEAYWDTYGFEMGDYGGELVVYYDNQTKKQDLILLLRPDRLEVNFGKLQFEEPKGIIFEEIAKRVDYKMVVTTGVIVALIVLDVILFIILRKRAKYKGSKGRYSCIFRQCFL